MVYFILSTFLSIALNAILVSIMILMAKRF